MGIKKLIQFFKLLLRHLNGDFAYDNYLKKLGGNCDKVMSKKEFLLNRQKEKWKKVNRCC